MLLYKKKAEDIPKICYLEELQNSADSKRGMELQMRGVQAHDRDGMCPIRMLVAPLPI